MQKPQILFVVQEANFCSRILIVPAEPFLKLHQSEIDILKQHSTKNVPFQLDEGKEVVVANLLVQNIIREKRTGRYEEHPWTSAFSVILNYIHEYGWGHHSPKKEKDWTSEIIMPSSKSFNHVSSYQEMLLKKKYNIVDSFLVLESEEGVLNDPPFEDADEMMLKYFSDKLNIEK